MDADSPYVAREPVRLYGRIYATVVAALFVVAFYFPDTPVALIGAVVSAALGLGVTEAQRARVSPTDT